MTSQIIFPRSPREAMAGWVHLPRFVDKIRLRLVGKLAPEYEENFTGGFDGLWLKAAGLTAEEFIAVVKETVTDGEVCDWALKNVKTPESEKLAFAAYLLNRGKEADPTVRARLEERKIALGLAHRADIQTFVDMIDADEKRL